MAAIIQVRNYVLKFVVKHLTPNISYNTYLTNTKKFTTFEY